MAKPHGIKRLLVAVLSVLMIASVVVQAEAATPLFKVMVNGESESVTLQEGDAIELKLQAIVEKTPYQLELPEQLTQLNTDSTALQNDNETMGGTLSINDSVLSIDAEPGVYQITVHGIYAENESNELVFSDGITKKKIEIFAPLIEEPTTEVVDTEQEKTPDSEVIETEQSEVVESVKPEVVEKEESITAMKPNAATPFSLIPVTEKIITSVILYDSKGSIINVNNPVPLDDEVFIEFTWELPDGLVVKENDTYEFDLPKEFLMYNAISGSLGEYGRYDVDKDGHVVLKFNKLAETGTSEQVHGTLKVQTWLNDAVIEGPSDWEIEFPIGDGEDVGISVVPKNGMDIQKDGKVLPYNGTTTSWDIIINTKKELIQNAVVTDTLPTGQSNALKMIESSFKVYHMIVNVDGTTAQGNEVDPSEYELIVGLPNTFELKFKKDINTAYKISYDAEIENAGNVEGGISFTNSATLKGDNHDNSAKATITTTYGKHIEKLEGTVIDDHRIGWTVRYNYNERPIDQSLAHLEDTIEEGFTFDLSTLEIWEMAIDDNGKATRVKQIDASEYAHTLVQNGSHWTLEIDFLNDISKAYEIVYQTMPEPETIINENMQIMNGIQTGTGGSGSNSGQINQTAITKSMILFDLKSRIVEWEILFNKDGYEMHNIVIKDSFSPVGMSIEPGSIALYDSNGGVIDPSNYTITYFGTGFELRTVSGFKISTQFSMRYRTDFNLIESGKPIGEYVNSASITWDDEHNSSHESGDKETIKLPNISLNNGKKVGSYNPETKEITWTVYVNYDYEPTLPAGSTIVDTIPYNDDERQNLIEDSIEIFHYSILPDGSTEDHDAPGEFWVEGNQYKLDVLPMGETQEATITVTTLLDLIQSKGAFALRYKTSVDGETVAEKYTNEAIFKYGTKLFPLKGEVSVVDGGQLTKKTGVQNGELVNWNVNLNFSRSTIENLVVTDTPSRNQRVLKETIVLYGTTLNPDGKSVIDSTNILKEGIDYDLTFNDDQSTGQQSFIITFKNIVNEGYVLKYDSVIEPGTNGDVENKIELEGKNTHVVEGGEDIKVHVASSGGSGTGNGLRGSVEIVKTSNDASPIPLAGAVFELYTEDGKSLWRGPATTDAQGKINFGGITSGVYLLKETKAPEGYLISKELAKGILITVNNLDLIEERNITSVALKNDAQKVVLEKTHKSIQGVSEVVPGAVYELFQVAIDGSETSLGRYTTGADGRISVSPIKPGNYYFVERSVPVESGMMVNTRKVNFVVKPQGTGSGSIVMVRAENFKGRAYLEKTNEKDDKLVGVTFDLYYNGTKIRQDLKTNLFGRLYLYDLAPGQYELKETKSVDGLIVNTDPIPFTIVSGFEGLAPIVQLDDIINYYGAFELKKVDETNTPLPGVEFELTDPEGLVHTLLSDSAGIVSMKDLKVGTYSLREVQTVGGHILNTTVLEFEVGASGSGKPETIKLGTMVNYKGSVEFMKVDEFNAPLLGAEFEITDSSGSSVKASSDASGRVFVENLGVGIYKVKETKAPIGYIQDLNTYEFEILASAQGAPQIVTLNAIVNYQGAAKLLKTDINDKPLAGAEFTATHSDGTQYVALSDQRGLIVFEALIPGTYTVKETKAPLGFILDPSEQTFVIQNSSAAKPVVLDLGVSVNYQGSVKLVKTDGSNHPLKGAEFTLTDSNDQVVTNISDVRGLVVFDSLSPGVYTLKETKAPNGYILNPTEITFEILGSHVGKPEVIDLGGVINYRGSVILIKTDTQGKPLQGAEFTLSDSKGHSISVVSDVEGVVLFENLSPGTYRLEETKAPEGYERNTFVNTVEIPTESDHAVSVNLGKFINKLVPEVPELPATGVAKESNYGVWLLGSGGLLIALQQIVRKRKMNKKK